MSEYSSFMDGGMDHEGGHDHSHDHGHDHGHEGGASQTPAYQGGLKGIKFSDLFSGINITPNFTIAMFFLGYALWLFVLYFIRHNEPFANQVIGTPNAGAPTVHQDRHLVKGVSNALPIKAEFFSPDKNGSAFGFKPEQKHPMEGQRFGLPNSTMATNLGHHATITGGRERVVVPHPEPLPGELGHIPYASPSQTIHQAGKPVSSSGHFGVPAIPSHQMPLLSSSPVNQHYVSPPVYSPYAAPQAPFGAHFDQTGATYHVLVHGVDGMRRRVVVSR